MERICLYCHWYKEFESERRKEWYKAEGQCIKKKVAKSPLGTCSRWRSKEEERIKRKAW